MTFGSLFAGIGGFDLGLERAGMECRWQVEIDAYANSVLAKHWPGVTRWGDVRTFPAGDPADWQVDLICAGVPCQPVSNAGKQKGASDERWMWGEALRVVADLKPRFFVAENPIGILNHDSGRTLRGLLRAIASVGYVCEWHVIPASAVGAPHRRERVWLVAHADSSGTWVEEHRSSGQARESTGSPQPTLLRQENRPASAKGAYAGCENVADTDGISCTAGQPRRAVERLSISRPRPQRRQDKRQAGAVAWDCGANDGCSSWGRMATVNECREQWAAEPGVGRVAHGVPHRVDRLRCLGNAIVPQVAEVIGRAIIELDAARRR